MKHPEIAIQFGNRLRDLLDQKDLSKAQLASKIGESQQTIGTYFRGSVPGSLILYKIAEALGVSMEFLISGKEPPVVLDTQNNEELFAVTGKVVEHAISETVKLRADIDDLKTRFGRYEELRNTLIQQTHDRQNLLVKALLWVASLVGHKDRIMLLKFPELNEYLEDDPDPKRTN